MLGGVRLPGDQEGRGQRHRSFFEEGPNATGVHGEAQGDKTLTGQWLLGGGVLATSGGESPEVFAVTTTVSLITANGWHRPGPPSLFLTETTLTPAHSCAHPGTHTVNTHMHTGVHILSSPTKRSLPSWSRGHTQTWSSGGGGHPPDG